MNSAEILAELVEQTQEIGEFFGLTFEVGEEYWAIADARLSAFSSEKMWAVAIEVIGYDLALTNTRHIFICSATASNHAKPSICPT